MTPASCQEVSGVNFTQEAKWMVWLLAVPLAVAVVGGILIPWLGPILAIALSLVGVVQSRPAWLVAATVFLVPFSLYLMLTPRFWYGAFLPALPLIAARAVSKGATRAAWLPVLALVAFVFWLEVMLTAWMG